MSKLPDVGLQRRGFTPFWDAGRFLSCFRYTCAMLALVTDLIFSTKIVSTATALGTPVKTVRTLERLREELERGSHEAALIDLNAEGVDVLEAVRICSVATHRPHIIAYASHVQAALIAQAREAGADEVLARSAFSQKLPQLLQEARARPQTTPKGELP